MIKPMTETKTKVADAVEKLEYCNRQIQARHRYHCGIEEIRYNDEGTKATTFFLSPDGQNGELFYELCRNGFQKAGYGAEYFWKVRNGDVYISYTEGDVSIYEGMK